MKENVIDILKNAFTEQSVTSIGKHVGIETKQAKDGIDAIIPTILAALLHNNTALSKTPDWLSTLSGLFNDKDENIQAERFDFLTLGVKGKEILSGLFGAKSANISDAVAQKAGISKERTDGLLSAVVPIVLAYLTNWMKKKDWSFANLMGNLTENKSAIATALPAGLSAAAFFDFTSSNTNSIPPAKDPVMTKPMAEQANTTTPPPPNVEEEKSENNWLNWLLWLVLIVLLLWLVIRSCNRNKEAEQVVPADTTEIVTDTITNTVLVNGTLNEYGDWVYEVGNDIELTLPDGVVLQVGSRSVEYRLVEFINSNKPVDKDTWFSLDRLYFETGSATLKPQSQQQVKNIAAIMKSYSDVNLKIGGYTDNTGSEDLNMRISQERANVALQSLVDLGVSADRLKAEGYGAQHPIANNETEEGRAQNRRIDVRVSAK